MSASPPKPSLTGQIWRSYSKLLILLVPAGAGILYLRNTVSTETFVQVTQVTSIAVTGLMVLVMLFRFRRERPMNKVSQRLAILTSVATLCVYLCLYNEEARIYFLLMIPAGVVGLLLGAVWGRATKVYAKGTEVYGQNAGWWLGFWALSFMATQLMILLGKREGVNVSLVVMAFGTGVAVGTATGLIREIEAVVRRVASGNVPAAAAVGAGAPATGGASFCESCGHALEPASQFCEACGSAVEG